MAGARLLTLALQLLFVGAVELNVNFSDVIRADFAGVGGVRHGFDYMAEETYRGLNSTLRALSLSRMCESRLRIARSWYGIDWAMPVWGAPLNFSTERFEQFASWVADMKSCNISVALQAGWWFTANTCTQGTPSTCVPNSTDVDTYTSWVSASVSELVVRRGFPNVDTLVFFTEPLSYNSGIIPPGYTQETFFAIVLGALHARLVADGVRSLVRIMAPNDGGISSPSMTAALQWTVSTLDEFVDVYSSHDYSLAGYSAWYDVFSAATAITAVTGKPFVMDEGGDSNETFRNTSGYGTYVGAMHAAAFNAGISATTMWLWQDQYYVWPLENSTNGDSFYNGLHRWGQQPWLAYNTTVRPAYYVLATLSRHFGPRVPFGRASSVRTTGSSSGVAIAALAGNADDPSFRAILLVNEGPAATNVTINLASFISSNVASDGGSATPALTRYAYDPAEVPSDNAPLPPSGMYNGSGMPLQDFLPVGAVVVWA